MVVGIIAEYNPMHIGHLHHIAEAKRVSVADFLVCAISGNFSQRGEPTILDKWKRAQLAVQNGADLVVEIPFCFATGSAQYFAEGGVRVLEGLGFVDSFCFGSESGDIDELQALADRLDQEEVWERIRDYMGGGLSFAKAREKALGKDGEILSNSNNILAVEYLRKNRLLKPYTIKRQGFDFAEGASAIRSAIYKGTDLDQFSSSLAPGVKQALDAEMTEIEGMMTRYYNQVKMILAREGERLANIFSASEGLEMKLIKEFRHADNLEDLIDEASGKRYARSRVQRLILHSLIGMEKKEYGVYTRILAAGPGGRELLRMAKHKELIRIPILDKLGDAKGFGLEEEADLDRIATDVYSIIRGRDLWESSEYVKKPIMV